MSDFLKKAGQTLSQSITITKKMCTTSADDGSHTRAARSFSHTNMKDIFLSINFSGLHRTTSKHHRAQEEETTIPRLLRKFTLARVMADEIHGKPRVSFHLSWVSKPNTSRFKLLPRDASALSKLNSWRLLKLIKIKSARSRLYRSEILQVNTH